MLIPWSFILTIGLSSLTNIGGHEFQRRQAQCVSQCENVLTAVTSCTNGDCLCPTVLVSGGACSSCLATTNATLVANVASVISYCAHPSACSSECSGVIAAYTACANNLPCLCPTLSASGSVCIACLTGSSLNPTDVSFISSYLVTDCKGVVQTSSLSSQSSAVFITLTSKPTTSVASRTSSTASSQVSSTSISTVQSKSGAWKHGGEEFGTRYSEVIMYIAMIVAGVLCALI